VSPSVKGHRVQPERICGAPERFATQWKTFPVLAARTSPGKRPIGACDETLFSRPERCAWVRNRFASVRNRFASVRNRREESPRPVAARRRVDVRRLTRS
jgi:hypothetical protein